MSMTKKDYELIAAAIYDTLSFDTDSQVEETTVAYVANRIAEALKRDNDRFDTDRFLAACGVTQ